jgi:hypothetical protein
MQTEYYQSFVSDIESKISNYIEFLPKDDEYDLIALGFTNPSYTNNNELFLKEILNLSPTATLVILRHIKYIEQKKEPPASPINSNYIIYYVRSDVNNGIGIRGDDY